ncbi:hypothetical protein Leryth_002938 [Lithospermum erythrorhizon]|nr:hypothetical protein Leryth_002938 [Lithospermum erythrorhizon]
MGKSAKKSATKVVAAPPAAVTKPLKKGKRDAEEIIEKPKSGKKQKNDVKDAIAKKIAEVKTVKKKVDTSSSEDDASDSEPEQKEPEKKVMVAAAKNVTNGTAAVAAKDDSDSEEDGTGSEEDDVPAAIKKPAAIITAADSSESDSEEESSDDDVPAAKATAAVAKTENKSSDDSEDDGSEESSDEEEPEQEKMKVQVQVQKKEPKTPVASKVQPSEGSKTLFVGNLPFSVQKADLENFFKEVGEVVDVRLALRPDGEMKGYGHVEFASAADAKKAVEDMNGQELLGRGLRLDLAKERGEYTPQSGNAFQKQTIFIRGLDNNDDEFKIKDVLKEHFGSCGEITRVSVPTDPEGYVKGYLYKPVYLAHLTK